MASRTGLPIMVRTQANDSPNMMHTAIDPKNGSVSRGSTRGRSEAILSDGVYRGGILMMNST
jgi:hypothetical protein